MQIQSSLVKIMRKKNWGDLFRFYEVIFDGENVGIIFAGQSISFPVDPDAHSLQMKIDWCSSEEINFNVDPGDEITFECESGLSILQVLLIPYYLIFRQNNWILLKEC